MTMSPRRGWSSHARNRTGTHAARSIRSSPGSRASASDRAQEQQGLHHPAQPTRLIQHSTQRPPVLLRVAIASQCHLNLSDESRQRRAELVRRLARKPPLAIEGLGQPIQKTVERLSQVGQFVGGP